MRASHMGTRTQRIPCSTLAWRPQLVSLPPKPGGVPSETANPTGCYLFQRGIIKIKHITTDQMPADIFTKALARESFVKFRDFLLGKH